MKKTSEQDNYLIKASEEETGKKHHIIHLRFTFHFVFVKILRKSSC